jgi:hypothetical protein
MCTTAGWRNTALASMCRRVSRTGRLMALNRARLGGAALKILGSGLILLASGCQAIRPPPPTPVPTPTVVEPAIDYLPGRGAQITGYGNATPLPITPEFTQGITVGISIVTATHGGQADFTVQAIADNQISVLVSATGPYRGARPLVVQDNVSFQVNADGNWTLRVEPLRNGGQPAFSGTGDNVSLFFDPPPPGQWLVSGAGKIFFSSSIASAVMSTSSTTTAGRINGLPRSPSRAGHASGKFSPTASGA